MAIIIYGYIKEGVKYLQGEIPYITKNKEELQPIFKFVYRSPTSAGDMHKRMVQYVNEEYPELLEPEERVDTNFPELLSVNGDSKGYFNFMTIPRKLLSPGLLRNQYKYY